MQAEEKPVGVEKFLVGRNITVPGQGDAEQADGAYCEYTATGMVHAEPLLIVPAWIMKYCILDLSPRLPLI